MDTIFTPGDAFTLTQIVNIMGSTVSVTRAGVVLSAHPSIDGQYRVKYTDSSGMGRMGWARAADMTKTGE